MYLEVNYYMYMLKYFVDLKYFKFNIVRISNLKNFNI